MLRPWAWAMACFTAQIVGVRLRDLLAEIVALLWSCGHRDSSFHLWSIPVTLANEGFSC